MEKTRADGLPLPQRYGAILTIIIGISMAVLDGAIANVALLQPLRLIYMPHPCQLYLDCQCIPNHAIVVSLLLSF